VHRRTHSRVMSAVVCDWYCEMSCDPGQISARLTVDPMTSAGVGPVTARPRSSTLCILIYILSKNNCFVPVLSGPGLLTQARDSNQHSETKLGLRDKNEWLDWQQAQGGCLEPIGQIFFKKIRSRVPGGMDALSTLWSSFEKKICARSGNIQSFACCSHALESWKDRA
jgi:hypothetical protein